MKRVISLAVFGLTSFIMIGTSHSSEWKDLTVREAVSIAIGGNCTEDALGPDGVNAVVAIILKNPIEADRLLFDDIRQMNTDKLLSDFYVCNLLRLTVQGDRIEAIRDSIIYSKLLDNSLKDFDSARVKDTYLQPKSENDRNTVKRLIRKRNEVREFISKYN